jgi:hypothetical protein
MALAVPIRERLGVQGRIAGHGLTVARTERPDGFVLYEGSCSCGRWSDRSLFRKLVSDAYARHLVDTKRDPEGKHDAIRGQLRAVRGPLAPSTAGDPKDPA